MRLCLMLVYDNNDYTHSILFFCRYCGYAKDRSLAAVGFQEEFVMSILCLVQCVLLASFAMILGAHRSDIMVKNTTTNAGEESTQGESAYEPPRAS